MKRFLPLALVACVSAPPPAVVPDPELTFLGHTIEAGLCTTTVQLGFSLSNPRAQTLALTRWNVQVTRDGTALPPQDGPLDLQIVSKDQAKVTLPVKVTRACAAGFASARAIENLQLAGKMFGNTGSEVVFEFEDKVELQSPKMPELSVDTTAQHYDEGRVEVVFNIKLRNPNPFPLLIDGFTYKLLVSGLEAASGEAWSAETAGPKSVVSFEAPVKIDPQDKGPLAALLRKPSFHFDLDAHLQASGANYPMRTLGDVRF